MTSTSKENTEKTMKQITPNFTLTENYEEIFTNKRQPQNNIRHTRSRSLTSFLHLTRQTEPPILSSVAYPHRDYSVSETSSSSNIVTESLKWNRKCNSNAVVTVVLIEAKDLSTSIGTELNSSRGIYCKFRLGTEQFKSKYASDSLRPEWRQRFKIPLYDDNEKSMIITLWEKGRDKYTIGRCCLDLSNLEKDRTHDLWQKLDDDHGYLHLSVTVCSRTTLTPPVINDEHKADANIVNWLSDWTVIGQLHVTVHEARGLPVTNLDGKISAYCALELYNERVQTPNVKDYNTLKWSHNRYTFNIYDITATLIVKVYNKAIVNKLNDETLGRVSIPLLRINNGELRWYALKDKSRRQHARGTCPRILLEMTLNWDAVKGSLRMFRPKGYKYINKPIPKFDMGLLYKNVDFIRKIMDAFFQFNENIKEFLEWDDNIKCQRVLCIYLIFCYFFRLWMTPLLLLLWPLLYKFKGKVIKAATDINNVDIIYDENTETLRYEYKEYDKNSNSKSFSGKVLDLQKMTLTISNGVDYIASVIDRLNNMTDFAVPFLTYMTISFLIIASICLYYVPFNYILMGIGIYKFARKRLKPDRTPNNDILDFISHLPDRGMLKDWKELDVPEYNRNDDPDTRNFSFTIPLKDINKQTTSKFSEVASTIIADNMKSHIGNAQGKYKFQTNNPSRDMVTQSNSQRLPDKIELETEEKPEEY